MAAASPMPICLERDKVHRPRRCGRHIQLLAIDAAGPLLPRPEFHARLAKATSVKIVISPQGQSLRRHGPEEAGASAGLFCNNPRRPYRNGGGAEAPRSALPGNVRTRFQVPLASLAPAMKNKSPVRTR